MKSRGCYETPGGSILLKARRAIESICMDGESIKTKDELISKYAGLIYDGLWWAPERFAIQSLVDNFSKNVQGQIKILAKKGNVIILSRRSDKSLYKADLAKEKRQPAKEAATSVGRTGSVKPTGKEKMKFSESQVASMKPHEYEKYEDAILESMKNGTFDYDMRPGAR